ncbi:MAG TPA: lactate utilization protein [Blastocatellia bacterium]|nr:lactate utilization protein [Blastocatellia bacterium]
MKSGQSKATIFATIKKALQTPSHVIDPGRPYKVPSAPRQFAADLSTRFVDEVTRLGAGCFVARSNDEAKGYVVDLIRKRGISRVALSNSPVVNQTGLSSALSSISIRPLIVDFDGCRDENELSVRKRNIRESLLQTEIGITGVTYGIADTGTLVIGGDNEYNRLASLLPVIHLAILRSDQLLPDLPTALEGLNRDGHVNQAITLITGPSRTADIELTLTIGVHGPKELQVVLLQI